jgi:cbb3-type cytochrome oxidase maturation protein
MQGARVNISYLLALLGLGAFGAAVWALLWAVDSGQYDDAEQFGHAALEEDSPPED